MLVMENLQEEKSPPCNAEKLQLVVFPDESQVWSSRDTAKKVNDQPGYNAVVRLWEVSQQAYTDCLHSARKSGIHSS
jgi:hypothetical protein